MGGIVKTGDSGPCYDPSEHGQTNAACIAMLHPDGYGAMDTWMMCPPLIVTNIPKRMHFSIRKHVA